MGGVFHPMTMLPKVVQNISLFNPMFYLVNGIRYSMTGMSDTPATLCAVISLALALGFFFFTVHLFKIGYKLRT
jgi:ABC-2 type transport system permease protein